MFEKRPTALKVKPHEILSPLLRPYENAIPHNAAGIFRRVTVSRNIFRVMGLKTTCKDQMKAMKECILILILLNTGHAIINEHFGLKIICRVMFWAYLDFANAMSQLAKAWRIPSGFIGKNNTPD